MATNPNIPIISQLLNKDWSLKALVPAFLCLIEILIFHTPIIGLLFFILTFSALDCIGFTNLTAGRDADVSTGRVSYRILMASLQVTLITLVIATTSFWAGLACVIAWWFCDCDNMFYILQNVPQKATNTFPWLQSWSIFFVLKKLNIDATQKNFDIVAIIGFIIAAILCFL